MAGSSPRRRSSWVRRDGEQVWRWKQTRTWRRMRGWKSCRWYRMCWRYSPFRPSCAFGSAVPLAQRQRWRGSAEMSAKIRGKEISPTLSSTPLTEYASCWAFHRDSSTWSASQRPAIVTTLRTPQPLNAQRLENKGNVATGESAMMPHTHERDPNNSCPLVLLPRVLVFILEFARRLVKMDPGVLVKLAEDWGVVRHD